MLSQLYFFLLITTGIIPVVISLKFIYTIRDVRIIPLSIWFVTRLFSDVYVYLFKDTDNFSFYTVSHISICIESLLIIWFFIKIQQNKKSTHLFYSLPIIAFILECFVFGSIKSVNIYGNIVYYLITVVLMLRILYPEFKQPKYLLKINVVIFTYHAIAFVYFSFIQFIRSNNELMQKVYPALLLIIISLNLIVSYILWTSRKI